MSSDRPSVDAMEQRLMRGVETATLCAYYGGLLTDKQREALRLHYEEDWSLGEIADRLEVSRQNVHELIARSEEKLRRYEAIVGSAARAEAISDTLARAVSALDRVQADSLHADSRSALAEARDLIISVIRSQEGEDDEHGV